MKEQKEYTISITYKTGVTVFADSEPEAFEKAKEQLGIRDGKFNDISYKLKVKKTFGPREDIQESKLPFERKRG